MNHAIQRLRELRARLPVRSILALDIPEPQRPTASAPAAAVARCEAARLAFLKQPITARRAPEGQWIVEPESQGLPEAVQGLVGLRPGWTPAAWALELRRKASRCEAMHPEVAARYRMAARLLTGKSNSTLDGISDK